MGPVAVARLEARQWRALDTGKVRGNLDGFDDKVADREERGVSKGFGHQRAVETTGREEAVIPQIRSVEVFDDLRHVKELADLEHPHLPCRFYVADKIGRASCRERVFQ